jgi:riboflavin synthase alpha subunit
MFTGIVRERGRVVSVDRNGAGVHLRIAAAETTRAAPGDSISVSGCCLTVTAIDGEALEFDAVPETLARTTLGSLEPGAVVNLEPALRAGEPLGGHFVQGHVDGRGRVSALEPEGKGARLRLLLPDDLQRYCVE